MKYVDGYLIPVAAARREAYIKVAQMAVDIFREYGATRVVECWGDDVPDGKLTSFPMAVKKEPDEVVVFSWIEWPSKAVRDEGMKKVMEDPRMQPGAMEMPFDGKRMMFGGFVPIVEG